MKRFFNVYRLLKASFPKRAKAFLDDRPEGAEFRAVMFLLALITGKPSLWSGFRSVLESRKLPRNLIGILPALTARMNDQVAWPAIREWLRTCPDSKISAAHCRDWLPRVARFSFHPGGDEATPIIAGRPKPPARKRR